MLELRADPAGLAPERLLVFELTGSVQNFARAATQVPGLELVASEDLDEDEFDNNPVMYMLISDAAAFRQLLSLWSRFQKNQTLPEGYAPWRNLFSQLRELRPWGPQDRVSPEDIAVLSAEQATAQGMYRIELELVFRAAGEAVEHAAADVVTKASGAIISRVRIEGAKYHALLADIPAAELTKIVNRENSALLMANSVMHIRPQSAVHLTLFETQPAAQGANTPLPTGEPIVAIFDSVPLAGHPRLHGRLSLDDPFNLEPLAVGPRVHGTAMASAVLHGDLAAALPGSLGRRVHFINMMFSPPQAVGDERFPDRLPADLFHEAVVRMKAGNGATAPGVIVINASLGDRNKPFMGRASGWARVLDYLSYRYGVLFVVSAGNHLADLLTIDVTTVAFQEFSEIDRTKSALRASGAMISGRRILAPAEWMNAITVGALHHDEVIPGPLPALVYDVFRETGLCTISSGIGPEIGNATKPDILAPGGRHHVRLLPQGVGHALRPIGKGGASLSGIVVAAPPAGATGNPDGLNRTIGTSVAAALTSGLAARAHEALEEVYDDFLGISGAQRAALLKAMLVHSSKWTPARDLIVEVLGPANNKQHVRQRDNVRRYLGFGAIDGRLILDCATDRATLWAVGALQHEEAKVFAIPLPLVMSGKAQLHELAATLAWLAPPRVGSLNYRGVRLKLVEPTDAANAFGVAPAKEQPDTNQAHSGTVIHRRWSGSRAAAIGNGSVLELMNSATARRYG